LSKISITFLVALTSKD